MTDLTDKLDEAPPGSDLAWWTGRLAGRWVEAGLPMFRRRSGVYRRKSARGWQPFSADLAAALAGMGPLELAALALAATAGVLYRYQGTTQPERIIVASRAASQSAGPAQSLPLPLDVTSSMRFAELLEAAATALADADARPGVSAADLAAALRRGDVANRHPFAPVVLAADGIGDQLPDLRNDVTVTVAPGRGLDLEYNANVHDQETVSLFGAHLCAFLANGLADPSQSVGAVEYLAGPEREALLRWSDGGPAELPDLCLHELFEAAVRAGPEREAVCFGSEVLTYGQLNTRANVLAHRLRSLGARRGHRIGLCLSASAELLVGLLAVLKSGAAVVPIVPTFPAARNRMAIEDSGLRLLVTESALREVFDDSGIDLDLVCVDDGQEAGGQAVADPVSGVTPADPVYVLFTSGSTGRPKGAVVRHRTLVNLVTWQRDRGQDPAGQRTLQRTSIGFDVSFQEIFSTLGFGGSLVVAPDEVRDDVSLLPEFIERHRISRLFLPPVALSQLAVTSGLEQRSLPTLTEIIVAGEQLQISMPIRRFFHQLDCALDNQYGPTETHVVTAFAMTGPSTRWAERPPIGRPVRNVRTYVLDESGQPVPAGVPGEIYVGGLAGAGGYLDDEQTSARFMPDPHQGGSELMYATGDRARFLPGGDIEYLGRDDDQVKIRGYRIELGEVEAALGQVPGVRQAAAAVHDAGPLGKQLTGYVVSETALDPSAIRRTMLGQLPAHMVPATSAIVRLPALPLTPTGKVSRSDLPPPPRPAAADAAPTGGLGAGGDPVLDSTERTVARVWSAALGLGEIGRDADFIEIGGHSLVGIQIVAQLNELYSVSLPLRSLLRGTTVAALAAQIDQVRGNGSVESLSAQADTAAGASGMTEVTMPDGRRLACLQPAETQYLYLDVFGHRTYHRGGITFAPGGVVFDVGAHIGLFTLYAAEQAPGARIFAFEPCPPLFDVLGANTGELAGVRRFSFGLGERADVAELTFYPHLTGMTSFHPDAAEERQLLSGILANLAGPHGDAARLALADSEQYLAERLVAATFRVERRTISDMIGELGIDRISLLKIDVQKAELEVLRGIAAPDWPKIDQLVIELHDTDGRLAKVMALLDARGYRVSTEQDSLHKGTVVHFVYAVRP